MCFGPSVPNPTFERDAPKAAQAAHFHVEAVEKPTFHHLAGIKMAQDFLRRLSFLVFAFRLPPSHQRRLFMNPAGRTFREARLSPSPTAHTRDAPAAPAVVAQVPAPKADVAESHSHHG